MKPHLFYLDRYLVVPAAFLIGMGLLMVTSSSMVISESQYHTPFNYLIHQAGYLVFGLTALAFVLFLPIKFWYRISGYCVLMTIVLLLLVLIPGIGREVNGSMRWMNLGFMTLQVSELAKLFFMIYLAGYLERRQDEVREKLSGFIKPLFVLGLIALLLLQQPDFGTVAVITVASILLLFLAGARLFPLMIIVVLAGSALTLLAIAAPYRLVRLTTFLHPWANQFDSGYQLTQALIAFGRGGFFGVGLGNSIQKLFYLPEAHTDFLFAVLGEELGFMGEIFVILLFAGLVARVFLIAYRNYQIKELFHAYLGWGLGLIMGFQAFINMAVNCGLLPTKGLTLPLLSYGGSSILVNCTTLGIFLRLSYENWRESNQGVKY